MPTNETGRKALTPKQQAFVDAYTGPSHGNATDAARRASYGSDSRSWEVQGSRLLRNIEIRAAIEARAVVTRSASVMDRKERQQFLTSIARGEIDDWEETRGPEGPEIVPARAKLKDRIRATELLGKMDGDYLERLDIQSEQFAEALARELARARKSVGDD